MPTAILVTGGAGYVGSHAAKALAAAGYLPVTFDNLGRGHREAVRWGPLVEGDLLDPAAIGAALDRWRPAAVMHFAAFALVGESVADPAMYWRNNTVGSFNLLVAMRERGVERLVFSSTCAVYGVPPTTPIAEDTVKAPVNPYGASKLAVERMLEDFAAAYGMRVAAMRYFNAAGADPDGQTGEAHDPETHLIPLALDAASGRRPALTVFGDDYPTPDGTCLRDYIHVADLAEAHVLALAALDAAPGMRAFNLGTGSGLSVAEIVAAIERATGLTVPRKIGPRRAGDPPALVADPSRARTTLGWKPRRSDIETIVRTAWAWHQRGRP